MAKTPENNIDPTQEALFREVDEDLRHEQMTRLWQRYGNAVIGGAVAIVVIVAGNQGWQAWQTNLRTEESARFVAAKAQADGDQQAQAREAMDRLAAEGSTGYASLAALYGAGLRGAQDDRAGAAAAYRALAKDGGAPPEMRDLAVILAVLADFETGDPTALETELAALTSQTSAWRFSARELTAHLAVKAGDRARAADLFKGLASDEQTPTGVKARAREALDAWGLGVPDAAPAGDAATAQ